MSTQSAKRRLQQVEENEEETKAQTTRPKHKDNLTALVFMIPWVIGFVVFTAGPIIASLYLSMTRYDLFTAPEWVGMANYARLFEQDRRFTNALTVTVTYVAFSVPLRLTFALLIAMVLNRGINGLPLYRGIYYLPSLLGGSVAIAILWRQLFGLNGVVNVFVGYFGVEPRSWIGSPDTALATLIALAIWQFGAPMIIFLAGLKQIPTELYEAAEIDGANGVTKFLRVTIPLLTPIIFFNLVMQTISSFQAFTGAYIISDGTGGPVDSTLFYTLYLFQQGFRFFRMGYASAMAWILLLIVGALTLANFIAARYWVYYGDEGR